MGIYNLNHKGRDLTGRLVLFLLLSFIAYSCSHPQEQGKAEAETVKKEIEKLATAFGAEVGLSFHDLESGLVIEINERRVMHAASLMKVPVMVEVFRRIDKGELSWEQKVLVRNSFASLADGTPYSLQPEDDSDPEFYSLEGQSVPLKELLFRMITVSSNLATNILIDLVKAEAVMDTMRELGVVNMKVLRGVEDAKAFEKGLNNVTDARDMRVVLEAIVSGQAASRQSCQAMLEILEAQKFREGIPAGLPAEVKVGNKTGSITRIAHDAAVVFPPGRQPYILVVLTQGIEKEEEAEKLTASISRLIYDRLINVTKQRPGR